MYRTCEGRLKGVLMSRRELGLTERLSTSLQTGANGTSLCSDDFLTGRIYAAVPNESFCEKQTARSRGAPSA